MHVEITGADGVVRSFPDTAVLKVEGVEYDYPTPGSTLTVKAPDPISDPVDPTLASPPVPAGDASSTTDRKPRRRTKRAA